MEFDREFLNVSSDLPNYERSTPKNPVDIYPEVKISILKPITNLAVNFNQNLGRKILKVFSPDCSSSLFQSNFKTSHRSKTQFVQ